MKVIELAAPRIDALHSSTRPDPIPGAGEVLIRLRAACLNLLPKGSHTKTRSGRDH